MIPLAREVFVVKCATEVAREAPPAGLRFKRGSEQDLARLAPVEESDATAAEELRARLQNGDHWVLGELDGAIATWGWLHTRERIDYPWLHGCAFDVSSDAGFSFDAWTSPALRDRGLRRQAALEENRVLAALGKKWNVAFYVVHQLEAAKKSLAKVGIELVPLWRVSVENRKALRLERLAPKEDATAKPAFINA